MKKMKKSIATMIACVCVLAVGCKSQPQMKESPPTRAEGITEAATADATTANQEKMTSQAEKAVSEGALTIELGKPISLGDIQITLTSLSITKDYQDKPVLKVTYDWENKSNKSASPYMTFILKGFQDGVETDDIILSENIDLGTGQKEVKPDGKISGAEKGIGITDINKPLLLELSELFSFSDKKYSMTIDNLSELE